MAEDFREEEPINPPFTARYMQSWVQVTKVKESAFGGKPVVCINWPASARGDTMWVEPSSLMDQKGDPLSWDAGRMTKLGWKFEEGRWHRLHPLERIALVAEEVGHAD